MDYTEWNETLARHFFNSDMAGKEVLLFVNKEKISSLGSIKGAKLLDFIEAIKNDSENADNIPCKRALKLYNNWRDKNLEYPPYIGYLALLVLVATTQGSFNAKAYYPRYWKLMGTPGHGRPEKFYETADLWDDLEKWSKEDKREELGRFNARIRGNWKYVGRPLSQTLLSDDERKVLPEIFFKCGFDPSNIPSNDVIKRGLIRYGKLLRGRTRSLLEKHEDKDQELINALLDIVITELESWGKYESVPPKVLVTSNELKMRKNKPKSLPSPLLFFRTCIEIDHIKQHALLSLRLKTHRPFPDSGLTFEFNNRLIECTESISVGWSNKLIEKNSNVFFDPSDLDWLTDSTFIDSEYGWKVTFKKSEIRVFLPGDEENIPGFVESQKLCRNCDFIILCHKSITKHILNWAKKSCDLFLELNYSGIPEDWVIFKGKNARVPCQDIDALNLSTLLRIQLEGGIGLGHSNLYLNFAPPRISIEGGLGNEKLLLNGNVIAESTDKKYWDLKNPPKDRPLILEISRENEILPERKVIQLVEPSINNASLKSSPRKDSRGKAIDNPDVKNYVTGALVVSQLQWDSKNLFLKPTYLSKQVTFIGQIVGQICELPKEKMPQNWTPVWVIYKNKKGNLAAHFCRQCLSDELAPIIKKERSESMLKWKKTFLSMRIVKIRLPALNDLWSKYLEAAENI